MATLKINGVEMPEPALSGITVTKEKIWSKNTGRTTDGTMTGDVIAIKTKLQIKWAILNPSEVTKINNAISSDDYFPVIYLNPDTNNYDTFIAYAGTPTYPVYDIRDGVARYQGVAVDLIEK